MATGALATVFAAVVSDVIAGERPLHTLSLGLVVAVVAALRLRFGGRRSGLFVAVNAAIIVQPVVHAVAKVTPWPAGHTADPAHAVQTDVSITTVHVLVAALL